MFACLSDWWPAHTRTAFPARKWTRSSTDTSCHRLVDCRTWSTTTNPIGSFIPLPWWLLDNVIQWNSFSLINTASNSNLTWIFSIPVVQHDISFTPSTKPESKGTILDCCKKPPAGYKGAPGKLHPQCLPIELEANDYQAKNYGKTCLSFVRSAPCPLCSLGPREHLNTVTSFLDLSVTYGSSQEEQNKLRLFKGGLLKFTKNKYGNVLLPRSTEEEQCSSKSSSHYCFVAGDVRGNQHPMLQSYHVIFLRNHNRIAENLAKLNPSWSDEKLFQEARRINNAEYQHIIYEEWLPLLFGPTLVSYYKWVAVLFILLRY